MACGVGRLASYPVRFGRLTIGAGSVVEFRGEAIVNAANEGGVFGGGVDGAINSRGGPSLIEARQNLPIVQGETVRIPTGEARTTSAGDLDASWVVRHLSSHAYPGPVVLMSTFGVTVCLSHRSSIRLSASPSW